MQQRLSRAHLPAPADRHDGQRGVLRRRRAEGDGDDGVHGMDLIGAFKWPEQ